MLLFHLNRFQYLEVATYKNPFIKFELMLCESNQYVVFTPLTHLIYHLTLVKISHKNLDDHQSSLFFYYR